MSNNDITGDRLVSRPNTKAFDESFELIFGKKVPNGDMHMIRESDVSKELDRLIEGKCRKDGRCQYAIDCGAEGDGAHCPSGKCAMPECEPPPVIKHCGTCGTHCDYSTLRNCGLNLTLWTPEVK